MTTSKVESKPAFAVWLTGLPASGKSTITKALLAKLAERGVKPVVLESDEMRKVLTPDATYSDAERDSFYRAMVHIGVMFIDHGVPVIFDATANRRVYRDAARARIPRFVEVYVQTPLHICEERDPKGIYRRGRESNAYVPGATVPYEPPLHPELMVRGHEESIDSAAGTILVDLVSRGWIAKRDVATDSSIDHPSSDHAERRV